MQCLRKVRLYCRRIVTISAHRDFLESIVPYNLLLTLISYSYLLTRFLLITIYEISME